MKSYLLPIFMLAFSILHQAQTIITDRPDQTEASSTVPQGSLQIESGIFLGFTAEKTQSKRQLLAPTTLFRYGIAKGIEIRVLSQFESLNNQFTSTEVNGISDLELGTKTQIFQKEDVNTEISFLSHLILPIGSEGLSSGNFGTINKISIAHDITDKVAVGYNLGYNYFGTGDGDFTYSLALGISVTDKVGIYLEPYGNLVDFNNHFSNFDAGMTYLLRDNLQLDFSFGTGINHTMNYLSTGFSWNTSQ